MSTTLHPLLTALSGAKDEETFGRLLRDGGRALLRDPAAIGAVAFAALGESGRVTQAARLLLVRALDEARMAEENDQPEGSRLLAILTEAMAEREGRAPLTMPERLSLARAYVSAGLVPPPFATLTADRFGGQLPDGATFPDLGEILDPILRDAGELLGQAHTALSGLLAGLPPELAAMLVSMIIARPGPAEARLGLYWLLDPEAEIRLAAATALLARPDLPPDLASLLPTLRKWMPEDPARAAVDAKIRRQMRSGPPYEAPPVKIHRAGASLPDGVGAQSLAAAVQIGGRRAIAMVMLKAGHGVKDAFLIPCTSATEQRAVMTRVLKEVGAYDLPPSVLATFLARGLGECLTLCRPPDPGMVDMAEIWGGEALAPQSFGTTAILAALERQPSPFSEATLIQSSFVWVTRFPQLNGWFEETGSLRKALSRCRSETGREAAVWKHLVSRRDHWGRIIATSAAVLQAAKDPDWPAFAAVAQALSGDYALKRIPILHDIVGMTLAAWADGEDIREDADRSGAGGSALLTGAGLDQAFVDGYLTACAIAPFAAPAEIWLGNLIGGIEFPGAGALEKVMAEISKRIDLIEETAPEPAQTGARLAAFGPDDWREWCTGFHALVTAAPQAWTARSLRADDKRLLRSIAQSARGQPDPSLGTVLPAWISGRHGNRR